MIRSLMVAVGILLLPGCGAPPKVPASYAGDIPITIVNHHSATVCTFFMIRPDDSKIVNWLGTGSKRAKIPTGGSYELRVQPGTYAVGAAGCQDGERWAAVRKQVHIGGPTQFSVGGSGAMHAGHGEGMKVVVLPVRDVQMQEAEAAPEAAPAETAEPKPNCVPENGHTTDSRFCCSPLSTGSSPNVTCK